MVGTVREYHIHVVELKPLKTLLCPFDDAAIHVGGDRRGQAVTPSDWKCWAWRKSD